MIIHQKFKDFNTKFEKEVYKNRKRGIKVYESIIIDADIIHQKIIYEYKIMHKNHADFCLVKCYHICGIFYLKVL